MLYLILCVILMIKTSTPQKLVIEDSGMANFGVNDNVMVFFVQVRQAGPTCSRIYVETAECCETLSSDEADCGTIHPMGGDMGIFPCDKPQNLTLFFPTPYGYNRHGSCLIDIKLNQNITKIRHRIEFDTVIRTGQVPDGLEPFYDPEKIKPCATLDLDPFNACQPVSCPSKYNGLRNYFNPTKQLCDKAEICEEGMIYLPLSNTCRRVNSVTAQDLATINEHFPINENNDKKSEIICHHGVIRNGVCICDSGWETVREDDSSVSTLNFCNVPCSRNVFSIIDGNMVFSRQVLFWAILIATAIVIFVCIWNVIYEKRYNNDYGEIVFFQPM